MRRILTVACAIMLAVALSVPAFAGQVVLKLGHIAEPVHPYGQGAEKFAELVKEKSGGDIVVKVFPSSQLGGQKDLIEGLIFGTVDMALVGTAVLGQFQPQISIFDLPFLFQDRPHAYRSLDSVGMDLGKALEPKGIKLLGYMENGIRHLTNNVREVKTPADMEGLKIRVMTNKIFIAMMKSLGASPTPMAFGELYSAMQQGTVDGQENPSAHIWTKRFFEVQKYASLTAHAYSPEPLVMSMMSWSRLSPEQQQVLQDAAREAIDWQRNLSAEKDAEYWKLIADTGKIKITEVDRNVFMEATKPVYEEFAPVVGQDNIDKINALRK
jgi:tripartite ATP-independent transporter DctP family solute receptor